MFRKNTKKIKSTKKDFKNCTANQLKIALIVKLIALLKNNLRKKMIISLKSLSFVATK